MRTQTTFTYSRGTWCDIESRLTDEREFASVNAAMTVLGHVIDMLDDIEPGIDPPVTITFAEDEAAWVQRVADDLDPAPVELMPGLPDRGRVIELGEQSS